MRIKTMTPAMIAALFPPKPKPVEAWRFDNPQEPADLPPPAPPEAEPQAPRVSLVDILREHDRDQRASAAAQPQSVSLFDILREKHAADQRAIAGLKPIRLGGTHVRALAGNAIEPERDRDGASEPAPTQPPSSGLAPATTDRRQRIGAPSVSPVNPKMPDSSKAPSRNDLTSLLRGSEHHGLTGTDLQRSLDASVRELDARTAGLGLSRKDILLRRGKVGRIHIDPNPQANGRAPFYELDIASPVNGYPKEIDKASTDHKVDPDFIRAIMYVENTHGYYDTIPATFDMNNSLRPMNINTTYWGDAWGKREALKNPSTNIDAGARLLRSIMNAMPGASIAEVATIYNNANAKKVSDYGARVWEVYKSKPWKGRQ